MNINLNRKGIMALEGLEEEIISDITVQPHDPDALVENELIELSAVRVEAQAQGAEIDEGGDIAGALTDMSEHMDASVQSGEGISAPVAQALVAAVEHFQARLGCPSKRMFPALESFSANRLEATKLALAQNKGLALGIEKALAVAQEGFLDNVKYRFKLIFSSERKLNQRMKEVGAAYDKKGQSDEVLKTPPFAKFFNPSGKDLVTSADVLALVQAHRKLMSNEELHALVKRVDAAMRAIVVSLKKTNFVADEKELEAIEALIAEVTETESEIAAITASTRKLNSDADFETLAPADKKQLATEVSELLVDDRLEKAIDSLVDAYYAAEMATQSVLEGAGNNSVGGAVFNAAVSFSQSLKKDVQLAKKAIEKAYDILDTIDEICSANLEVCHASITYVAMSTSKA